VADSEKQYRSGRGEVDTLYYGMQAKRIEAHSLDISRVEMAC